MKVLLVFLSLVLTLFVHLELAWPEPYDLPDARVGEAYEYGVAVNGLVEPLSFNWDAGDKPAWITFNGPIIKGKPIKSKRKPYRLHLVVTGSLNKSLEADYHLSVRPAIKPLRINTEHIPPFIKGERSSFTISAGGGEGNYAWKNCKILALPEGLTLDCGDKNQHCVVKGNPKKTGNIHLKVTVFDESEDSQTKELKGRVIELPPPLKINSFLPSAILKSLYSAQLSAIGGYPPYEWKIKRWTKDAPSWAKFHADTGILQGTPDRLDKYDLIVEVKDRSGKTATEELKLEVKPVSFDIVISTLPLATYNALYSVQLSAIGGYPPYEWKIKKWTKNAPSWVKFDPHAGILRGTPDRIGEYSLTVEAKDSTGKTILHDLKLYVEPIKLSMKFIPKRLPEAVAEHPYLVDIFVAGSQGLVEWNIKWENKPKWIKTKSNGPHMQLKGTPLEPGNINFSISVRDMEKPVKGKKRKNKAIGFLGPIHYSLVIQQRPEPETVRLLTNNLPCALVSFPYTLQLSATGGEGELLFSGDTSGAEWLTISKNGVLEGVPSKAGKAKIEVFVVDSRKNRSDVCAFVIDVIDPSDGDFRVMEFPEPVLIENKKFSFQVPVTGGVRPYDFHLIGDVPPGVVFDSTRCFFSGIPEKTGEFPIEIKMHDASAVQGKMNLSFRMLVVSQELVGK